MEWKKYPEFKPNPGVYAVKICGFINYCSFSNDGWYWMQALNSENMRYLPRYPLVGMPMHIEEWLDITGDCCQQDEEF